jgi:hypothetical protein
MTKLKIDKKPSFGTGKYEHLDPIVDALIADGNEIVGEERWKKTKDGWLCVVKDPINFSLVKQLFELPSTINCYEDRGTISCATTWSAIIEATKNQSQSAKHSNF